MNAAIYVYSASSNIEQLNGQLQLCHRLVDGRGWTATAIYIDAHGDRTELAELLDELDDLDVVVTYDLVRLGRRRGEVGAALDRLRRAGVGLAIVVDGELLDLR